MPLTLTQGGQDIPNISLSKEFRKIFLVEKTYKNEASFEYNQVIICLIGNKYQIYVLQLPTSFFSS